MRQRNWPVPKPPEERFWPFVQKTETCWVWTGYRMRTGHGRFALGPGASPRIVQAHRFAYELLVGPIPEGLTLDHLCRNPPCVRPSHLEPVTQGENTKRHFASQTHCKYGHEYTPENTYIRPDNGRRHCKTCRRRCHERSASHGRAGSGVASGRRRS